LKEKSRINVTFRDSNLTFDKYNSSYPKIEIVKNEYIVHSNLNEIYMHWREKELLIAIKQGKLTTSEVVGKVNMSKVTALKYLEALKKKNLVDFEEIGTAKIWFLKEEKGQNEKNIKPMKLLVADDDRNVITIIRDSFDPKQFEILEAMNGKEALGMVFAESPDILVLDIMMP
jgi:hypothetical protein